MQIVYFDCQPDVDLDSLTASFFSAGLSFDIWHQDMKKAQDGLGLKFDISLVDDRSQSIVVKKLGIERGDNVAHAGRVEGDCAAQEVLDYLNKSTCENAVTNLSRTIFARLLESEAQLRGVRLNQLVLNKEILEKTLVQIIGFSLAFKAMKIENVFSAPVSILSGMDLWPQKRKSDDFSIQTIDLLVCEAAGATTNQTVGLSSAVVAAVLTTIVSKWSMPAFAALRQVGYGSGGGALPANLCRVLLGELKAARFRSELISVLEANLDDLSPQVLAFAAEELFGAGALEVFVSPVIMKKGRGGHLLTVLCNLEDKEKMQSMIFAQTSSLGVRSHDCERSIAERDFTSIVLEQGHNIRIKVGFDLQGNIVNAQPEYEDCASYARFSGRSVQEVIRLALTKIDNKSLKQGGASIVLALLFACLLSTSVVAKSMSQIVQFSLTLRQAPVGSLKNEGGFEIYSWNIGGKWHYSLLPATKEEKTFSEVTEYSVTLKTLIELEAALGKLAPGVVTWHNHVLKPAGAPEALSLPHQAVLRQLKKYCKTRQLTLVI